MPTASTTRSIPLARLRAGQTARVCGSALSDADSAYLRALGICADARVRVCRSGEPCIVVVGGSCQRAATRGKGNAPGAPETWGEGGGTCWLGSRLGLAKPLAEGILVSVDP